MHLHVILYFHSDLRPKHFNFSLFFYLKRKTYSQGVLVDFLNIWTYIEWHEFKNTRINGFCRNHENFSCNNVAPMTNLCLASKRTFRVLLLELRKFVPTNISTFTVIKLKLFRITVTTDKNKNMTKHSSSHTPHRRSWHGPPLPPFF